ncbi:hypothetical protein AMJ57_00075 [Parcubacteria bacterium SG8_24]|nr:MAG: hypothetical protein AMJ57_00075 [Parcubacteria bacterium SG8_24]
MERNLGQELFGDLDLEEDKGRTEPIAEDEIQTTVGDRARSRQAKRASEASAAEAARPAEDAAADEIGPAGTESPVTTEKLTELKGDPDESTKRRMEAETKGWLQEKQEEERGRERLIESMEKDFARWWDDQVKIYDQETKLGMDTRSVHGAPTRERISDLIELFALKDADFRKAWERHLDRLKDKPSVEQTIKDPEKGPRTLAEYAAEAMAGHQGSAFDAFLGAKFSGEQAMEQLFKRMSKDLGVEKKTGKRAERAEVRGDKRAIEVLQNDTEMLRMFQEARRKTWDRPAEDSLQDRRQYVEWFLEQGLDEMADSLISYVGADEATKDQVDDLRKRVQESYRNLLEQGQNPDEQQEWKNLVLDGGAEILREEIILSARRQDASTRKDSDAAAGDFIRRLQEALKKPAELKKLRKKTPPARRAAA